MTLSWIGASNTWRWYGYNNSWVNIDGSKMQSVSGGGHSGGGLFISTEDHARFGLLFLNEGAWNGKQLISKSWIKKATSSSPAQVNYGYMWWLNKKGTTRYWEGVPENVFYARGPKLRLSAEEIRDQALFVSNLLSDFD